MVPFQMMVYLEDEDRYVPDDEVTEGHSSSEYLGYRTPPPPERRRRHPGMVHLSRSRRRNFAAVSRLGTSRA